MNNKPVSGIYCIKNLINNKRYIGLSKNLNHRFKVHKHKLNNNSHINKHLQQAWNKYGENNFDFYIIEKCDKNFLKEREKYYIEKYKTNNRVYGYNKTSGGDGVKDLSFESREKISISETKFPIVCLNLDGTFVKEYRNCNEAAKFLKGRAENIRECCKKRYGYKTQYGYIWMYKDEYLKSRYNLDDYKYSRYSKKIDVYTLDGKFVNTYDSGREVERQLGINYRNVSQVCRGDKRQSKGYICRFHNDKFDKFNIYKKNGKLERER